jgi:predicted dienelactone hydrolase
MTFPTPACWAVQSPYRRRALWSLAAAAAGIGLLAAGGVCRAQAAEAEPAARAPAAAVRTLDFDWVDAERGARPVAARLYLPEAEAAAAAAAKWPLVVFSHGMGGSRYGYSYLGRHWAQQGFAVLHLQHQGSDRAVWTSNLLDVVGNLRRAASDAQAIARAQDVSFGISRLLAEPEIGARIDAQAVAVAGHSYGANTALLVAGARVERDGKPVDLRDARVKAAILLSAPPFYGESDPARILRGVTIPTLHLTGTRDEIRIPGYYSSPDDRLAVFEAVASDDKLFASFDGGTHSIFTDRIDGAGYELNQRVKGATRELTALFLRAKLVERLPTAAASRPLLDWLERHRALFARLAGRALPAS